MKYLLLLFLPLLAACTLRRPVEAGRYGAPATSDIRYTPYEVQNVNRPETFAFPSSSMEPDAYRPDTLHPAYLPQRYVRVNFHIMNTTDTFYRFSGAEAEDYISRLLYHVYLKLTDTPPIWLSPDSTALPALPRHLGIELARKADGSPAIYEHYDDELYWYLHKGPKRNRSDRAVIRKYAVQKDSVLNIFIMGPPREQMEGDRKDAGSGGIYLDNAIKVTGILGSDAPPWNFDGLIAHEIGHALGLYHAWTRNDGCADTPVHKNNAWSLPKSERGPGKSSNNLMDYSRIQQSLTPCQIGRMHARMSDITSHQRKWLVPNWCDYQPAEPVRITSDLRLEGARDYRSDIYVEPGGRLYLNSRLHLPSGAGIYVAPGATLTLGPAAIIHNSCGGAWRGIFVGQSSNGQQGQITIAPEATFLNEQAR